MIKNNVIKLNKFLNLIFFFLPLIIFLKKFFYYFITKTVFFIEKLIRFYLDF